MADRRRRRKRASQDSEEEDESGSGTESGGFTKGRSGGPDPAVSPSVRPRPRSEAESECESEDDIGEAVLTDYDSADAEENGSHSEGDEEEIGEKEFGDEEESKSQGEAKSEDKACEELLEQVGPEDDDEDNGGQDREVKAEEKSNLAGERQSGDGQESTDDPENKTGSKASKKLDDDEDRKNPAYIPRKGLFFEHDVRGQAHEEDIRPKGRHRKLWKDEGRWEHDKFREDEQAPKSREELIAMYGYDIRNANGPNDSRLYRSRKPRYGSSPSRDKRWRNGEKPNCTSWSNSGSNSKSLANVPHSSSPPSSSVAPPASRCHGGGVRSGSHSQSRSFYSSRPPQASYRGESRANYKGSEENHSQHARRNYTQHDGHRSSGLRGRGAEAERSPSVVVEEEHYNEDDETLKQQQTTYNSSKASDRTTAAVPEHSRQREDEPPEAAPPADASPAAPERTVERKSYSLARRTRTKPSELGKQASLDDPAPQTPFVPQAAPPSVKSDGWEATGDSPAVQGGLSGLDQDLARLSLAGQNWAQSPPSYLRAEMRGIPNSMHMGSGPPPQYNRIEEMGVGAGRAKRYSSQRQRPVPEPAPMHIGIMEGHYYEPMSFQGPIYAHSDSPTPLPPQGMLVQPEMHLTHPGHPGHPGLHPHQSGAALPNPAMYAGPPVSMTPGQPPPQQLLAPPFYPPPGVMAFGNTNFTYPAGATLPPMYPNPQAQAQVYGGVTYYDTVQQQAQPKPSPPRRSSQPVTIKPPPPEVEKNGKDKDKMSS
ncbi:protein CASC3 isoform X1 [Scleropages formosus]|uniref:Protein CASC3 n=1 Tax=Scleropages formosus TaxID=113540 RepID=A0A8C9QW47_SCLFO|nr:protein CASC3 isoform X1 [Scleropages formosus]